MKKIFFLILLALTFALNAQNTNNLNNAAKINLGFHGLDLSYALPLSNKFLWENNFGIGMGMNSHGSDAEFTFDLAKPVPYFKSEVKYMYNINKRSTKGKNTNNNSGNYIGLQTKYSFGNTKHYQLSSALLTEIHWGIQRSLGGKFLFSTHIGLGYIQDYDFNDGSLIPTAKINFAYRLF